MRAVFAGLFWLIALNASAQTELAPRLERIASEDGAIVGAHVFDTGSSSAARGAVVLLHGGGWVAGDATWTVSYTHLTLPTNREV